MAQPAASFDALYDSAASIEEVYAGAVETLVSAARTHGEVLYAVPGSPFVAERTVELLRNDRRVEVTLVPALSFVDLAWDRLRVDPVQAGVRLVDGHRFAEEAAGQTGPLLVAQCDTSLALSAVKLAVDDGPVVTVLQRLGLPDEAVFDVTWDELDRAFEPDHLTCLWIPRLADPVAGELTRLVELVRTLRERCPWDRSQTHQSLTRHLIEETYEVLEAIDELTTGPQGYEHLEEELGDLLFQVAFHSNLAAEAGQFSLADVARGVHDKLVERHPHVFGPPGVPVPDWEELKRAEKGRASVMDGVPGNLPSLLYAFKVQSKAASVGFDWKTRPVRGPSSARSSTSSRRLSPPGPGPRRRSPRSWATCCSRWSTWPATWASTPRRHSGTPPPSSASASPPWRCWPLIGELRSTMTCGKRSSGAAAPDAGRSEGATACPLPGTTVST